MRNIASVRCGNILLAITVELFPDFGDVPYRGTFGEDRIGQIFFLLKYAYKLTSSNNQE